VKKEENVTIKLENFVLWKKISQLSFKEKKKKHC